MCKLWFMTSMCKLSSCSVLSSHLLILCKHCATSTDYLTDSRLSDSTKVAPTHIPGMTSVPLNNKILGMMLRSCFGTICTACERSEPRLEGTKAFFVFLFLLFWILNRSQHRAAPWNRRAVFFATYIWRNIWHSMSPFRREQHGRFTSRSTLNNNHVVICGRCLSFIHNFPFVLFISGRCLSLFIILLFVFDENWPESCIWSLIRIIAIVEHETTRVRCVNLQVYMPSTSWCWWLRERLMLILATRWRRGIQPREAHRLRRLPRAVGPC